jgi:phosphoribulokinase
MLQNSFMSRANSIVVPGGKLDLAMQLILTPMILQLMERSRRAGGPRKTVPATQSNILGE